MKIQVCFTCMRTVSLPTSAHKALPRLRMRLAERCCAISFHPVTGKPSTLLRSAALPSRVTLDFSHPLFDVPRAIQHPPASRRAVGWIAGTIILCAHQFGDVHHTAVGMCRAEHGHIGSGHPASGERIAILVRTSPCCQVHHAFRSVSCAEHGSLAALFAVIPSPDTALHLTRVTGRVGVQINHPWLRVV